MQMCARYARQAQERILVGHLHSKQHLKTEVQTNWKGTARLNTWCARADASLKPIACAWEFIHV